MLDPIIISYKLTHVSYYTLQMLTNPEKYNLQYCDFLSGFEEKVFKNLKSFAKGQGKIGRQI